MSNVDILEELSNNFLISSLDTNIGRAFPDVRDGLKPGMRTILWEMWTKKYLSSKPHVKSAKISGGVIANWWPHSDVAIYETFARMSQPFTNNIPEIDFHGNNGNIILGGDAVANQRYTEARLSKVVEEGMFSNINKNTVDMVLNFSEDAEMPTVLPAVFPRLLVNGAQGIGVSIANQWLPHNFTETGNLILKYLKEDILDEDNYYPDFPTGGTIINESELSTINKTGRGKVIVEAAYRISGNEIDFYEMPYQVYIEPVIEQIKEAIEAEKISGIKEVLNKSDKNKISLTVVCSSFSKPENIVNQLFNHTDLRKQYNANQNGIVSKTPIMLNLRQVVDTYIEHNLNCIYREFVYDLDKAKARIHILEGLLIAINNIDEVIEIIRNDKVPSSTLQITFDLDEKQVQAILDMKLSRLSKLETNKLEEELQEKEKIVEYCEKVINDENERKNILIERLSSLVSKYGDKRRTKVIQKTITKMASTTKTKAEFIPETVIVQITSLGYMKVMPVKNFRASKSNLIFEGKTLNDDYIKLFSNKGKMYRLPLKTMKMCGSGDKGTALGSILELEPNEKIIFADFVNACRICDYILFVSKSGMVKKTKLTEYDGKTKNTSGVKSMNLKDGDEIIFIECGADEDTIALFTKTHKICFKSSDVSYQGKTAGGVKGINTDNEVVSASFGNKKIVVQKRGGKGSRI